MILCFGCSFTEHTTKSFNDSSIDTDFIRWPKIVGKEIGIESYNLGMSGLSNDVIAQWIKKELIKQKSRVKLVLVLWTEWYRFAYLNHMSYSYMMSNLDQDWLATVFDETNEHYMPHIPPDWIEQMKTENQFLEQISRFMHYRYKFGVKEFNKPHLASEALLEHQLISNYYTIQKFCESFNIPVIHAQGVACTPMSIESERKIMDVSYTEYIKKLKDNYLGLFDKNFIGWPLFKQFGGFNLTEKLEKADNGTMDYWISKSDLHPNEKGHYLMADYFIDKIKELKIF